MSFPMLAKPERAEEGMKPIESLKFDNKSANYFIIKILDL